MMRKVAVLSLMLSILVSVIARSGAAQDNLKLLDLVANPNCSEACWQGIEVSMTEERLVQTLNDHDMLYEKDLFGDPVVFTTYNVVYEHPYIVPDERGSILIFVVEGVVTRITIRLNEIPLETLLAEFGAPLYILNRSGEILLPYAGRQVVFSVNGQTTYSVELVSQGVIMEEYINSPFRQEYSPCTGDQPLCSLATATQMPRAFALTKTPWPSR